MSAAEDAIREQIEKIYGSTALRDELMDAEASVLLGWGEQQVMRLAHGADDFERDCRMLRQLIKHINRFVGQREFNDADGQRAYLEKIVIAGDRAGYPVTVDTLAAALGPQPDMAADLLALLNLLDRVQRF